MAENFLTGIQTLTVPELTERLGLAPSKVRRLIEDQHLAAVRIDGVLRVPAAFLQGGEPLSSLRGTLLVLRDAGYSEEESVEWLFTENDEVGGIPIEALQNGRKSAVRRATQSLAF